jgi:hypothetical protein
VSGLYTWSLCVCSEKGQDRYFSNICTCVSPVGVFVLVRDSASAGFINLEFMCCPERLLCSNSSTPVASCCEASRGVWKIYL